MKTLLISLLTCIALFLYGQDAPQKEQTDTRKVIRIGTCPYGGTEEEILAKLPSGTVLHEYTLEQLTRYPWRSRLAHLPNLDFQYTFYKNGITTLYSMSKDLDVSTTDTMQYYLSNTIDSTFDPAKIGNTKGKYLIRQKKDKSFFATEVILTLNDSICIVALTRLPNNPDRMTAIKE